MPVLDWIFAGVLLLSMLLGGWRGLVYELLSLMGWIAAFWVARWFGPDVAGRLPINGASDLLRDVAGFLLVFVATVMLVALLAVLSKNLLNQVGLRPVDRMLGAAFGLTRGALLLLLATALVLMTAAKDSVIWRESTGARWAVVVLKESQPMLPAHLAQLLPP